MDKEQIEKLLYEVLNDYFETQEINEKATKTTILFGNGAILDSMGLVNVIIDIESRFLDDDKEISLTSEQAMSRRNSPFRTIETLADYIFEQIGNSDG